VVEQSAQLQQQRKGNGGVEEKSWDLPKKLTQVTFSLANSQKSFNC